MISRLRGVVREQRETHVLLDVGGVCYEVLVPPSILHVIPQRLGPSGELELTTFHYQQLEVGRGVPMLIGFLNEIEREFFVRFISVSGVGPRAALKALTQPIPAIAQAIDDGNIGFLRSLPGIGEQRAKDIVAKLQGKVGKFGLIQATVQAPAAGAQEALSAIEDEAITVLLQLEYKKPEAKQMVRAALARNPRVATSEELLNAVYRQQRAADPTAPSAADEAKRPPRAREPALP